MSTITPHGAVIDAVFTTSDEIRPAGRFVHLALSVLADEAGHVETTVHTLEHMTGLLPTIIEAALGFNPLNEPLFPGNVTLTDGIIVADLPTGA
ncbi:hypothetical protein [Microbacterium maritypicum]